MVVYFSSGPEDSKKPFMTVAGEWNGQMHVRYGDQVCIYQISQNPVLNTTFGGLVQRLANIWIDYDSGGEKMFEMATRGAFHSTENTGLSFRYFHCPNGTGHFPSSSHITC